jgi:hypothetical protein
MFGLIAPIATGYIIAATGSYDLAFVAGGVLLVTGAVITLTLTHAPIDGDLPAPAVVPALRRA